MNRNKTKKAIAFVLSIIINSSVQVEATNQVAIPQTAQPTIPSNYFAANQSHPKSIKSIEA